jgi:hypothetical protein
MRWSSAITVCAAGLAVAAWAGPQTQQRPQLVDAYLTKSGFSADEISGLEAGRVISRVEASRSTGTEILVVAAVKILVPRAQVVSYYGQMIAYVDGNVTIAFGRFSSPPAAADVKGLAFDRDEVEALKSCRPGNCDIRVSGTTLEALRSSIDWNAADHAERVNAFARKAAVDYVTAYQARGDAALVTYNDRAQPVRLQEQWLGILGNSPFLQDYAPELKRYLERYPKATLAGASNIFYWSKEAYGLAPIIGIVHGVIYEAPSHPDRTMVVQKQLYASHYLNASLAVATLLDGKEGAGPATYLLYTNRSRGDLLKGGFGGLKRNVARSQARRAAEDTLGTIKQVLEAPRAPRGHQ